MSFLLRELFVIIVIVCLFPFVSSTSIPVGGSVGWTLGVTYPPINAFVGDSIVFEFSSLHEVSLMASLSAYTNCDFSGSTLEANGNIGGGINGFANQFIYTVKSTDIPVIYFACPVPGHCAAGLKVTVNVQAQTTNSTTTAASSTATSASSGGGGSSGVGNSSTGGVVSSTGVGVSSISIGNTTGTLNAGSSTGSGPNPNGASATLPQKYIIGVLAFLSLIHLIVR